MLHNRGDTRESHGKADTSIFRLKIQGSVKVLQNKCSCVNEKNLKIYIVTSESWPSFIH